MSRSIGEQDEERPGAVFLLSTMSVVLKICAVWLYWLWFLVPLGAPVISVWHAAGVLSLVRLFATNGVIKTDEMKFSIEELTLYLCAQIVVIGLGYAMSFGVTA
tara:strand:+ start:126 stop:437 length:312 start_codon:yes stop_codon:yes gene_type:complete